MVAVVSAAGVVALAVAAATTLSSSLVRTRFCCGDDDDASALPASPCGPDSAGVVPATSGCTDDDDDDDVGAATPSWVAGVASLPAPSLLLSSAPRFLLARATGDDDDARAVRRHCSASRNAAHVFLAAALAAGDREVCGDTAAGAVAVDPDTGTDTTTGDSNHLVRLGYPVARLPASTRRSAGAKTTRTDERITAPNRRLTDGVCYSTLHRPL